MNSDTLPLVIALSIAAAISVTVATVAWNRRQAHASIPLALLSVAVTIWTAACTMEYTAQTLEAAVSWAKIEYLGIASIPLLWLMFARAYSYPNQPIRAYPWLWIVPVITIIVAMTNQYHGWLWSSITVVDPSPKLRLSYSHGPWFWITIIYSYVLLLAGAVTLVRAIRQFPAHYRAQTVYVLCAVAAPWIANVIYLGGWSPLNGRDPTPLAFALSAGLFAWSMYNGKLLDLIPVARDRLIEYMQDGMLVLDIHSRIVDINPAAQRLLAIQASDIGQSLDTACPTLPDTLKNCQFTSTIQFEVSGSDGNRTIEAQASPLGQHLTTGRLLVLRDITERVHAEEAMAAANRAKSTFLATMSHEIRTPMNGVIGMTELILDTPLSSEQQQYVTIVHESAQSLLAIINDILDFSKIEAGHLELEDIVIDPRAIIGSVVGLLEPAAKRKGIVLRSEIATDIPRSLNGDPNRLRQILLNLVGNAIKFTERGAIDLRMTWTDGAARIEVQDTGIGMNQDVIEHLFTPFKQGDDSIARRYGGTGLGLAITRRLVELLAGHIEVQSLAGQGSTFIVTLPLSAVKQKDDLPALALASRTPEPAQELRECTVLIAEDNLVNQKLAVLQLHKLGYDVDVVENGREAVEAASTRKYALVLMDCNMPELDGLAATAVIRAAEASGHLPRLPIVAMTASAMSEDREACLLAGMDDYVSKPVKLDVLRTTIERWVHTSVQAIPL